jgi:hypothetical protein
MPVAGFMPGVCTSASNGCMCRASTDCTASLGGTACAQALGADGTTPIGVEICTANDGAPYHGCNGVTTCSGGSYCCVTDSFGNHVCAQECTSGSMCGTATCSGGWTPGFGCGGDTFCTP